MNRFSWFGAGALGVERQRTGLKLGSGSEPALELLWWKRGNRGGRADVWLTVFYFDKVPTGCQVSNAGTDVCARVCRDHFNRFLIPAESTLNNYCLNNHCIKVCFYL